MKYLSAGILSIVSALIAVASLDDKIKVFNVLSFNDEIKGLQLPKFLRILLVVVVGIGGFCLTLVLYKNCSLSINIIRLQIGYACLVGAGSVDLRENRIPNIFPVVMSISGLIVLAYMYFSDTDGAFSYILSSIIGTVLCVLFSMVIYFLTKKGIGMGDIKLLCSLSLLCGANSLGGTVAVGSVLCGLVTIVLLITKKKKIKNDSLPFAPFLFLGFVVSVFLSIA